MATYTCQFVDSVSASPTVRMDLDNGTTWRLLASGTKLDPPPLRRAVAATLLRDGARIPASAYDNRVLQLALRIQVPGNDQASNDQAAAEFQRLCRELDRPTNILRWAPGTSQPVFFRTFRSDLQDIQWDPVDKRVSVAILAEPFALGVRETFADVTVANNPASGSNPMYWDVTGVKGDVESPAVVALSSATWDPGRKPVLAMRRRGTPSAAPHLLQAESMTMGTDTSATADASFSGGSKARCTFATNTAMVTRVSATHPATASTDARGTYRVFVRIRNDAFTTTVKLRTVVSLLNTSIYGPTVTNNKLSAQIMDLGLVQLPASADPIYDAGTGQELPVAGQTVGIQAQRTAGSDPLDIDYILFVPADDAMYMASWPLGDIGATERFIVDGVNEATYVLNASGQVAPRDPVEVAGGYLNLAPNTTNRIYHIGSVDTAADAITTTVTAGVSYHPRYLYVRGATT